MAAFHAVPPHPALRVAWHSGSVRDRGGAAWLVSPAGLPGVLGLAAYLACVGLQWFPLGVRPLDVLRCVAALTLMWASAEKWAYPHWRFPIFVSHPAMSFGFYIAFYMRAAGTVEFTLAFALLGTPLVRRQRGCHLRAAPDLTAARAGVGRRWTGEVADAVTFVR